jgi:predicted ribosome quality control (RQC) complex YloA/Tae2 family protein
MLTDWLLIRRLAQELEERLRGARVEDAGVLADGRVALVFRAHGTKSLLGIDLFASPPLVTLEEDGPEVDDEPGFVRALARSLRGMTLAGVSTRRYDRLVRLSFAARSRFGVGDQIELYLELVPRFGNLVLVKGERVVAALKEFAVAENPRRAVQAGEAYALPPLPATPRTLAQLPEDDARFAQPLFLYRRGGKLLQAYLAPLEGFDDAEAAREPSLLRVFAELRAQRIAEAGSERTLQRRHAIIKRLDERERKLRHELDALAEKRRNAQRREALREEGERIFATLHSLDESDQLLEKERAGKLFVEYKKLTKSLPHIDERERGVAEALEAIDTLRWESERAGETELDDVQAAVEQVGARRKLSAGRVSKKPRKRPRLELRTPRGSRIVVGRSPIENAELTFQLARPNDLWFHAQGIPGAHVILARDDRGAAPEEDIQAAASLAAFYSRAKAATSVAVDYTLRKHVRKQRAAPPGLVWYTHAKTTVAQPRPLDSVSEPPY